MYLKNKTHHINLRLSYAEHEFCKLIAEKTGKNVSLVIRELIEKEMIKDGYQQTSFYN